jgi:hypothetical protein
MNIVSGVEGARGRFLRAELRTVEQVFPEVHVYQAVRGIHLREPQNIVLLALKRRRNAPPQSSDPHFANLLAREIPIAGLERDMPILRDNFAPVEDLLLPAVQRMEEFRAGT